MNKQLRGKKVLFFSPAFFNYENLIAEKMREMGAIVDMYDERCITKSFDRALLKIFPSLFQKQARLYYEEIIKKNQSKDYDYIFIIKCDMTPIIVLQQFRIVFPKAKLCLYLWDSVKNIPAITEKFKYFDEIYSFDLDDCKKIPILRFRPLFFADQFRRSSKKTTVFKHDICFIGTIHSDRYAIIKQIQMIAERNSLKCYWFLYLQSSFMYWFYKILKSAFRDAKKTEFSFVKKTIDEISKIEEESRIILDIQHPAQTGLTMRTIEMLGMNKKLITTNNTVKEYDFYNPNNIAIIERKRVNISRSFFEAPYIEIDKDIYENYSINTWILDILN